MDCPDDWLLLIDADAGEDILLKAIDSDWRDWLLGSTLIFWCWPKGFQRNCAQDGMPKPKPEDVILLAPKFSKILS
jgi:hypothetical protein